jgi:hypothetical protein
MILSIICKKSTKTGNKTVKESRWAQLSLLSWVIQVELLVESYIDTVFDDHALRRL